MKTVLIIFILSIIIALNTCNENPLVDDNIPHGRRDYVWTVDTLNTPFNIYYRMWGSSLTDVWCVSPGDWDKSIAHFDGEGWSIYGISGLNVPSSIYGFSNSNIFIGAQNGQIWRFDGNNWILFAELTKDGHNDIGINNIWGEFPNNFYAFGAYPDSNGAFNNSVIAHFQNNKWTMFTTEDIIGVIGHLYKNGGDQKIYLNTYRLGGGEYFDSTLIFEYSQGIYEQLYSSVWTRGAEADISLINNEVYFILGNEIAKRKNNQFQTFLLVDNPNFYQRIWGRNSKDIFLFMTDGLVHCNGTDQEYLLHFDKPRTQIFGAVLFENEVFFLVYESETHLNLIFHGKLDEQKGGESY
jgi:hypothetical protein